MAIMEWMGYDNSMICFEWHPTDLVGGGSWKEMWRRDGLGFPSGIGMRCLGGDMLDLKSISADNFIAHIPNDGGYVFYCAMLVVMAADAPNGDAVVQCGIAGGLKTELFGPTTLAAIVQGDTWYWNLDPSGMVPAGGGILPANAGVFNGPGEIVFDVVTADSGGVTLQAVLLLFGMEIIGG
jgi:hypothetical protein